MTIFLPRRIAAGALGLGALCAGLLAAVALGDAGHRCFAGLPASDTCSEARIAAILFAGVALIALSTAILLWRR